MPEHYFTQRPAAAHHPGTVHVVLPDLHLRLETDSGMFSPGRLDAGTRVLLETVPAPPRSGDLLDLGCGYGPIALTMAARSAGAAAGPGTGAGSAGAPSPAATVWAVDVNTRALDLCARNAASAGLSNVRAVTADQVLPAVTFGAIWSNPPIRIGKQALHDLLAGWLGRLAPAGAAYLVAQRHLGSDSLQRWLAGEGWEVSRIRSRSAYRVLCVTRSIHSVIDGGQAAGVTR